MPERMGSIAADAAGQVGSSGSAFALIVMWMMALAALVVLLGVPSAFFARNTRRNQYSGEMEPNPDAADSRASGRRLIGAGLFVIIGGWLIIQGLM